MTLLGIALIVLSGFLVSRAAVGLGLHRPAVLHLLSTARQRPRRAVLYLLAATAGLSAILPNTLTVLALLPLLEETTRSTRSDERTLLSLAVIYGANIGGMASLTGSPANLYLLATLHALSVPEVAHIGFGTWLAFGLPLALLLVPGAWAALALAFPRSTWWSLESLEPPPTGQSVPSGAARLLVALAVLHLPAILATNLLVQPVTALHVFGVQPTWGDMVATGLLGVVLVALFLPMPWLTQNTGRPLLTFSELWAKTPWRGLAAAAGVAAALFLVARAGAAGLLAGAARAIQSGLGHSRGTEAAFLAVTTFATEVLNNTTVATGLVPLAASYSATTGGHPLALAIGVSLASTCAFMTPVATPVNALAVASLRRMRIRRMMAAGFLLNLMSIAAITLWVTFVLPAVFS